MEVIKIAVQGKYARSPKEEIVCGNSDYYIEFEFSEEWESHDVKTARFIYNGHPQEEPFQGNRVQVPKVINSTLLEVGVFAGDLCTTTPALITCRKSILCKDGLPPDPTPDVYTKLIAMIENMKQSVDLKIEGVEQDVDALDGRVSSLTEEINGVEEELQMINEGGVE